MDQLNLSTGSQENRLCNGKASLRKHVKISGNRGILLPVHANQDTCSKDRRASSRLHSLAAFLKMGVCWNRRKGVGMPETGWPKGTRYGKLAQVAWKRDSIKRLQTQKLLFPHGQHKDIYLHTLTLDHRELLVRDSVKPASTQ